MDTEFHYYMMYLVAAKAGFGAGEAGKIAYASQYVDDNSLILEIDKDQASAYRNYISQTMNILKPKSTLFRIYPLFHFIPGDPVSTTAFRKDGKMHWLNTTPRSENARKIMDAACATGDLYRLGVACHSYADTWAHQNFVGYCDGFNALASPLSHVVPNIGHADAQHNPDWPALVWRDTRLLEERRDNKALFLEAAQHLLHRLAKFADPALTDRGLGEKTAALLDDLAAAIGERDQKNAYVEERIARYRELSCQSGYGATELPVYDDDQWLAEALHEEVRGLRDQDDDTLSRWDPLTDVYTWANREEYQQTDWYRFQEAVKDHQNTAWDIVSATNLKGLQLPEL